MWPSTGRKVRMMTTDIKGVVFDWGGVIIDEPSGSLQRYCSRRLEIPIRKGSVAIWKFLPEYQSGKLNERQFWEAVCTACDTPFDVIPAKSLWSDAVRTVFDFRPEVVAAIQTLKHRGMRVGFLSNTEPEAARFFHEMYMDAWFDASVLSCEVGIAKPQREIYHLMADKLQLVPATILFLDDRQENIDGAVEVGMNAAKVSSSMTVMRVLEMFL